MPTPPLTYLELNPDIGLAPAFIRQRGIDVPNAKAGELDPLHHVGFQVPMPVALPNGDIVNTTRRVELHPSDTLDEQLGSRILPGTRIVETREPAVVNALMQTGLYHQVDPPEHVQPRKPKQSSRPKGEEE